MQCTGTALVLMFSPLPLINQNCPEGWYENEQEEKGEVSGVDSSLWVGLSFLHHWLTHILWKASDWGKGSCATASSLNSITVVRLMLDSFGCLGKCVFVGCRLWGQDVFIDIWSDVFTSSCMNAFDGQSSSECVLLSRACTELKPAFFFFVCKFWKKCVLPTQKLHTQVKSLRLYLLKCKVWLTLLCSVAFVVMYSNPSCSPTVVLMCGGVIIW